jgi:hypothetical protein
MELEQLLRKHQQHTFADMAKHARETYTGRPEDFRKLMTSVDWWGGSGALWDINLGYATGDAKVGQQFQRLIIRLVEQLDAEGLATERSRSTAQVFREWLSPNP